MKLKSFKKDKESWSMDADEKLEQLAQIERDKQEAVEPCFILFPVRSIQFHRKYAPGS